MLPTPPGPAPARVADVSIWATSPLAVAVRRLFCRAFFFSPPSYVALWDSKTPPKPACERISYGLETSPSQLLPQDGSPSLNLSSLFLSFIFCPTSFQMGCLSGCLVSSASIQKLFCESCSALKWSFDESVGRKWSPRPIPPPSWECPPRSDFLWEWACIVTDAEESHSLFPVS